MGVEGEGGIKNFKLWVTSFMDGPLQYIEKKFVKLKHFFVLKMKLVTKPLSKFVIPSIKK